jgi:hypothetical protein
LQKPDSLAGFLKSGKGHTAHWPLADIIAAIMAKHNGVSDAFCSDAGIRLMRQDSDLILASTRACLNAGIAALPVHDSLIVPLRCEQTAAAILIENFERRYPIASPCRVTTNG